MNTRHIEALNKCLELLRDIFESKNFRLTIVLFFFMLIALVGLLNVNLNTREIVIDQQIITLNSLQEQIQLFTILKHDILRDYDEAIPDSIIFINKLVKLDDMYSKMTMSWLIGYLVNNKPAVVDALKRFHFYEPIIQDSLKAYGLPRDLQTVFLAESWAYPLAVSNAKYGGAVGISQFMRLTALEWGAEIDKNIDMRRDPWYMSKSFCDYIKWLRENTNSYEEALRAYNTGLSRFLTAAEEQPWIDKTWYIDINDENNIYLFWLLAWKIIYDQPEQFGISIDYNYPPAEVKFVEVQIKRGYQLDFMQLASLLKCDVFNLKTLNPSFIAQNNEGNKIITASSRSNYIRYLKIPASVKNEDLNNIIKNTSIKGVNFLSIKS